MGHPRSFSGDLCALWDRSGPRSPVPRHDPTRRRDWLTAHHAPKEGRSAGIVPCLEADEAPPKRGLTCQICPDTSVRHVPTHHTSRGTRGFAAQPLARSLGPRSLSASRPRSLVGVTGFEPAASSSRTTRATKLRHTPLRACLGYLLGGPQTKSPQAGTKVRIVASGRHANRMGAKGDVPRPAETCSHVPSASGHRLRPLARRVSRSQLVTSAP